MRQTLSHYGERAHLNPLYRDIALRWSHSATLDENQEDKLELEYRKDTEYTHLDENQEDKLVLSRMLQRVYILLHIVDY